MNPEINDIVLAYHVYDDDIIAGEMHKYKKEKFMHAKTQQQHGLPRHILFEYHFLQLTEKKQAKEVSRYWTAVTNQKNGETPFYVHDTNLFFDPYSKAMKRLLKTVLSSILANRKTATVSNVRMGDRKDGIGIGLGKGVFGYGIGRDAPITGADMGTGVSNVRMGDRKDGLGIGQGKGVFGYGIGKDAPITGAGMGTGVSGFGIGDDSPIIGAGNDPSNSVDKGVYQKKKYTGDSALWDITPWMDNNTKPEKITATYDDIPSIVKEHLHAQMNEMSKMGEQDDDTLGYSTVYRMNNGTYQIQWNLLKSIPSLLTRIALVSDQKVGAIIGAAAKSDPRLYANPSSPRLWVNWIKNPSNAEAWVQTTPIIVQKFKKTGRKVDTASLNAFASNNEASGDFPDDPSGLEGLPDLPDFTINPMSQKRELTEDEIEDFAKDADMNIDDARDYLDEHDGDLVRAWQSYRPSLLDKLMHKGEIAMARNKGFSADELKAYNVPLTNLVGVYKLDELSSYSVIDLIGVGKSKARMAEHFPVDAWVGSRVTYDELRKLYPDVDEGRIREIAA